ncbi:uncharacterized protein LOC105433019 isoform X3 [Pogonomyrmex barbatus]|uniref:Uncharacterized protein LOC105433019 isoform X3 n=1 Tax=Pogonomyrmex barbatus TaxID=144034 RepID=A0A6I9WRA7_9HYME|nr:uncharacterized protein LOC105433019 isoform X3 [Pogonomyrmex barbatus]
MRTTHAPRTSDPFRGALVYKAKLFEVLDEKEGKRRRSGTSVPGGRDVLPIVETCGIDARDLSIFFEKRLPSSATWRQGQGLKKILYLTNQHITRSKNLSNTTNGGDGETKKSESKGSVSSGRMKEPQE